jgi:hypothetical protein
MHGSDKLHRLDRILSGHGALAPEIVVELGFRICEAVDEAWRVDLSAQQPVDRELQPGTIYITGDGWIPIGDLGLSDLEPVHGDPTAVYRAPETLEGHEDHPTADVFVLGSILYEMATGEPLFHGRRAASGDSLTAGLQLRLSVAGVPDRLDEFVPGLGKVVLRCLQLDRAERWPEAGTVARALQKVQKHAGLERPDLEAFLASDPDELPEQEEPADHGIEIAFGEPELAPESDGLISLDGDPASISLAFSLQDEVFVSEEEEASKPLPWASDEETEDQLVARVTARRMTPMERQTELLGEEEPTFGKAVKWFVRRVVLAVVLVLLLAFTLAWLGLFPGGTERQTARVWQAIPEGARGVVPEGWVTGVQTYWIDRPARDVATPVGKWMLGWLPEGVGVALSEEPPTPPPVPGTPEADGVVASAEGWIEPEEGQPVEQGKLTLGLDLGGRARGEKVRVLAHTADGAVAGEGLGDQPLMLSPGSYDLELVYRESEYTDEYRGWLRGVQLTGGWATHFAVELEAPIGFLKGSFERSGEDVTDGVRLEGWPEPIEDEPEGEPLFVGEAGALSGLKAGRWRIRATLQEEGRAPATRWFVDVLVEVGERTTVQRSAFPQGELLDPTGPGVRIAATNRGRDVGERSQVLVFSSGVDVHNAVAFAQGPAAYYFDVPAGTWDVQVVFQPDPTNPRFRAEKVLKGVVVEPEGVVRQTVEMGLDLAEVKVRVRHDEVDVSSALRVAVINAGASYEGATRAVDADGAGPHPLEPGEWDIYLELELEEGTLRARYRGVELKAGDLWQQRLTTVDPVWER